MVEIRSGRDLKAICRIMDPILESVGKHRLHEFDSLLSPVLFKVQASVSHFLFANSRKLSLD